MRYGITDIVLGSWRHLWAYCPIARSICCMKLAARRVLCVVCCVSFAVRRVRLRQGLNYWLGFNKFNCTPHRTAALWPPVGEQWTAQRAIKCGLATSLGLGIGIGGTRLWPGKKQCHKLHLLLLLLLSMSTILFVRPLIKHSLTCSPVKQINQQSHRQTERLREREIARERGREIGQIGEV